MTKRLNDYKHLHMMVTGLGLEGGTEKQRVAAASLECSSTLIEWIGERAVEDTLTHDEEAILLDIAADYAGASIRALERLRPFVPVPEPLPDNVAEFVKPGTWDKPQIMSERQRKEIDSREVFEAMSAFGTVLQEVQSYVKDHRSRPDLKVIQEDSSTKDQTEED